MIYPKYSQLSDMFSKHPVCGVWCKFQEMGRNNVGNVLKTNETQHTCAVLFTPSSSTSHPGGTSQGYYTGNAARATLKLRVAQPTIQINLSEGKTGN